MKRAGALSSLGVALLAIGAARGCGSSVECGAGAGRCEGTGGTSSGTGASAGSGGSAATGGSGGFAATGGSSLGGSGGGPCTPQPLPDNVPADWQEFSDYSCGCRVYVPGPSSEPVTPIEWEACPSPGPLGVECRRMKTPWTTKTLGFTALPRFWYDAAADRALLQFGRLFVNDDPNVRYRLVAEADGPVHEAFLQVNAANQGCELMDQDVRDDRFVFGVLGDSWSGPLEGNEGIIAGKAGTPPPVTFKAEMDPNAHRAWRASANWLIEWDKIIRAHDWELKGATVVYDPTQDPEGMPVNGLVGAGEAVFIQIGVGGYSGVMSWTLADGLQPLIRWPGDYTQGAGNFNTDGVHMVWTHGQGAAPGTGQYSERSIMVAPFTTDPLEVAGSEKRLRSDPGPLAPYPFGVGCGYAARMVTSPGSGSSGGTKDLLVVRLSDGVSWLVKAPPAEDGMGFSRALGATCTEVFADGHFADQASAILRIRLDSLGPGMPPD